LLPSFGIGSFGFPALFVDNNFLRLRRFRKSRRFPTFLDRINSEHESTDGNSQKGKGYRDTATTND